MGTCCSSRTDISGRDKGTTDTESQSKVGKQSWIDLAKSTITKIFRECKSC